jgi:hypothetical protein
MANAIRHSSNFKDRTVRSIIGCQEIFYSRLKESLPESKHELLECMFNTMNYFAQDLEDSLEQNKNLKKDNDGMCVTIDNLRGESLSTYLEKEELAKRVAELQKEVERLRELNNNQAWLLANNRTKRSDFHV